MSAANERLRPEPVRRFLRVESRDFDEIAHALAGMDTELRQMTGGPFRGVVEVASLDSLKIMRVVVNQVIRARGSVGANTVLLSLLTPLNEEAIWRGQRLRSGDLNLNGPSSQIDHRTGRPYDDLTIILKADRLQEAGETLLSGEIGTCLERHAWVRPASKPFTALESAARTIFDLVRLQSPLLASPGESARLEDALLAHAVAALRGERASADARAQPNRRRVVRRAEEFMLANLRRHVLMTELCRELGVSERTLRYAFGDIFGTSPLAYFKMLKLNAIRREIVRASSGAGVQEVARQWGVVHLGNFAADYKRLFGEAPSVARWRHRPASAGRGPRSLSDDP